MVYHGLNVILELDKLLYCIIAYSLLAYCTMHYILYIFCNSGGVWIDLLLFTTTNIYLYIYSTAALTIQRDWHRCPFLDFRLIIIFPFYWMQTEYLGNNDLLCNIIEHTFAFINNLRDIHRQWAQTVPSNVKIKEETHSVTALLFMTFILHSAAEHLGCSV